MQVTDRTDLRRDSDEDLAFYSLTPSAVLAAEGDDALPAPNRRGKCETCGTAIDQWEMMGVVYPRHCDRHEHSAMSASVAAAREAEKDRRRATVKRVIPELYHHLWRAHHAAYPPAAWASIKRWEPADNDAGIAKGWGLIVFGDTGLFKSTMVCHHVANIHIRTGYSIAFLSVPEFETVQRLAYHGTDDEKIAARLQLKSARNARILILDDLGKESSSDAIELALHSLISHRLDRLRPTIITLNASATGYEARLSPERAKPLMRRLVDYNRAIQVTAE
jgi:DNA replication protein DnaC